MARQLSRDELELIRKRVALWDIEPNSSNITSIIKGDKMSMHCIITYLNHTGRVDDGKKSSFVAVTYEEFESDDTKQKLAKRWDQLSGIAVVQLINKKHYQSAFFRPGKMREPIIVYDSRKVYNESERVDLSGEKCSELNTSDHWTKQVKNKRDVPKVRRLVTLLNRVAKTADEIKIMSGSVLCSGDDGGGGHRFADRKWKILRSFVSQTDDISCGVLTCLFLESMMNGFDVSGVGKDIEPSFLQEYRWIIAGKCCDSKEINFHRKKGSGEIIDLIDN